MGWQGLPREHQGSEGHQGSPSLWALVTFLGWGDGLGRGPGISLHWTARNTRPSNALWKPIPCRSFLLRSWTEGVPHLPPWQMNTSAMVLGVQSQDRDSAELLTPTQVLKAEEHKGIWCWGECFCGGFVSGEGVRLLRWGCKGGFTRAQSRGHTYWVLLRSSRCCVGINGQIRKRKWVGGQKIQTRMVVAEQQQPGSWIQCRCKNVPVLVKTLYIFLQEEAFLFLFTPETGVYGKERWQMKTGPFDKSLKSRRSFSCRHVT